MTYFFSITDIDECRSNNPCGGNVCVNTPGSYSCTRVVAAARFSKEDPNNVSGSGSGSVSMTTLVAVTITATIVGILLNMALLAAFRSTRRWYRNRRDNLAVDNLSVVSNSTPISAGSIRSFDSTMLKIGAKRSDIPNLPCETQPL